jgi:hypothetical protein
MACQYCQHCKPKVIYPVTHVDGITQILAGLFLVLAFGSMGAIWFGYLK